MKTILYLFILSFPIATFSQDASLKNIEIAKFKVKFDEKFFKKNSNSYIEKWKEMNKIVGLIKNNTLIDVQTAAFILSTIYVETAIINFKPAEEIKYDGNKDRKYWQIDPTTKKSYYGRGWVQLTHKENYKKIGDYIGIDLVNNPENVLNEAVAYKILKLGIQNGWFETYRSSLNGDAGKIPIKIEDFYDNNGKLNYKLARAIINANVSNGCKKSATNRFEYKNRAYLPLENCIDASEKTAKWALIFYEMLLYSINTKN